MIGDGSPRLNKIAYFHLFFILVSLLASLPGYLYQTIDGYSGIAPERAGVPFSAQSRS